MENYSRTTLYPQVKTICFYVFARGAGPGANTREISDRLMVLKSEIDELDRRERELDQHKMWVQQSIKNVTDDVNNHQYPFQNIL